MAIGNSIVEAATVIDRVADLGSTLDEAITNLLATVDRGGCVVARDGTLDTTTTGGQLFVELLKAVQGAVEELQP